MKDGKNDFVLLKTQMTQQQLHKQTLSQVELTIMDRGFSEAAIVVTKSTDLRKSLLPIWKRLIHEILIHRGECGCQQGNPTSCFLNLPFEAQEKIIPPNRFLTFETFQRLNRATLASIVEGATDHSKV